MARNILVINCDIRETRVALIENGIIAELQIERAANRGTVGNIVLGKVTRVLPGMQAAFIDVGLERAAFLHVEDLIRPVDFEAYLTGGTRDAHDAEPSLKGEGGRRAHGAGGSEVERREPAAFIAGVGPEADDDEPLVAPTKLGAAGDEDAAESNDFDDDEIDAADDKLSDADETADDEDEEEEEEPAEDDEDSDAEASDDTDENGELDDDEDGEDEEEEEEEEEEEAEEQEDREDDEALADGEPEDAIFEGNDELVTGGESPGATASESVEITAPGRRRRRRRRRRRGRGNGAEVKAAPQPKKRAAQPPNRDTFRSRNGRSDQRGRISALRVSRSVPITEVVKEGDEVIVQISKEPIGTKGARVTSHVSLPGRYVVYLPTVEHVGISKRIGSHRERQRLRDVMEQLKPEKGGLIVRTVAEGLTKRGLKADIGYLVNLWSEILAKRASAKAPVVLYSDLDLVLKTARDLFTGDIEKIVIDDRDQYARLVRFIEMFMPERAKDIELYTGDEPIFDAYGIEDEIGRALSRKVPLPSGGYLIIDQAEALTAIDVNTGRFVGKGSKDLEETALKTNLEAVDEIAYQLRFRNIGGLVILDLIDMEAPYNREKVWRALEGKLAKDKAKTTINRISELGLIEMTRKRTRESLSRTLHEPCFYCDGTGQIMSRTTIAYEILRQIRRERHNLAGYSIVVNAHPAVIDLLMGEEKAAIAEAERRYMRRIEFNPRREYHIEQFDLQGK